MRNMISRNRARGPRKQKGQMGIIGALLGLVILALVLYFVVSHFVTAKDNQAGQAQASDLITMISGSDKLFHGTPGGYPTADFSQTLIQNGVVPSDLASGPTATTIDSPFGQVGVVGVQLYSTTSNDGVQFTYPNVPQNQCSDFVTAVSSNVAKVTVNGTTIVDRTQPASSAAMATALGTACSSAQNSAVVVTAQ